MKRFLILITVAFLLLMNIRMWAFDFGFLGYFGKKAQKTAEHDEYAHLKREVEKELKRFKSGGSYSELNVQVVLGLLDAEIELVDHLLAGSRGTEIERALSVCGNQIKKAPPSVLLLYDKFLDLTTFSQDLFVRNKGALESQEPLVLSLNSIEKCAYLKRMRATLNFYAASLRSMQYNRSSRYRGLWSRG